MTRLPRLALAPLLAPLCRFARDERGSATIEFALLSPMFIVLFLASFESGMLLVRQVMLDRALDVTVRHVRLGHFDTTADEDGTYDNLHRSLKATMCQTGRNNHSCMTELKLEMLQVDPRNWTPVAATGTCVDRADDDTIVSTTFTPGVMNQLMVLRACELFDPFFPTFGLGAALKEADGAYRLRAVTAYVVEPS